MRVTKKLVATICLPIYRKVLEEGKKDNLIRFKKRLRSYYAQSGICYLFFQTTLNDCNKLFEAYGKLSPCGKGCGGYLYKIPNYANSKKEAVELIKKRIEFLEKWNK